MEQRTYKWEDLDTHAEIVQEFQALRDEAIADIKFLHKRIDELEKSATPPKSTKKKTKKKGQKR